MCEGDELFVRPWDSSARHEKKAAINWRVHIKSVLSIIILNAEPKARVPMQGVLQANVPMITAPQARVPMVAVLLL